MEIFQHKVYFHVFHTIFSQANRSRHANRESAVQIREWLRIYSFFTLRRKSSPHSPPLNALCIVTKYYVYSTVIRTVKASPGDGAARNSNRDTQWNNFIAEINPRLTLRRPNSGNFRDVKVPLQRVVPPCAQHHTNKTHTHLPIVCFHLLL